MFGRRVNNVLSRALGNLIRKKFGISVKITVDDNGFVLTLPKGVEVDPEEMLLELNGSLREEIEDAVLHTQMAWRVFRHVATRGLMILRRYLGHEVSMSKQQTNAETLFRICLGMSGHPLVKETVREIVEDKMDVENASRVLRDISARRRKVILLPPYDVPSPFAHGLITRGMSDVILMEDRVKVLKMLYDLVLSRLSKRGSLRLAEEFP